MKRKAPHWLVYVAAGAVVLAVVGLVVFLATRDPGGDEDSLNVAGKWRTNYGVLTLTRNGDQITGAYDGNGGVTGQLSGDQVTGYWMRTGPTLLCPQAREGTRWWGRFVWTFSDANTFTGANSACDAAPQPPRSPWSGARIGPPPR